MEVDILVQVSCSILFHFRSEQPLSKGKYEISVPVDTLGFLLAMFGLRTGFPYQQTEKGTRRPLAVTLRSGFQMLDVQGFLLLLCAVLSFTACFMEAGSRFAWNSVYVITLLVASAICWSALLLWERRVTRRNSIREPTLPWRFFTIRFMVGILVGLALVGGPASVSVSSYLNASSLLITFLILMLEPESFPLVGFSYSGL